MRHDVDSIDRALIAHAQRSPMEYHGYTDGRFLVRFYDAPGDPEILKLNKREAHLVCYGIATGRRSNDLGPVELSTGG